MKKIFLGFRKQAIIKLLISALIIFILIIFPGIINSINDGVESTFAAIKGSSKPDSSIVLLPITGADIDRIGSWPIKRSYYALLIKSLTELKVKKIGLEVFLTSKFSTQAIYDNLLTREIIKSGKVVLGSVAGQLNLKSGKYITDSLSLPSPKLINEAIPTGHLNFIENNGIYIPLEIKGLERTEKAFSFQLSGLSSLKNKKNVIKVNFVSGWKNFKRYSLLEFFNLLNNKSPELNNFKNKIVIIGITDPQIVSAISTNFDDNLPGLGLHAFALDNILNNRSLNFDYINFSKLVFIVIIILLIFFERFITNTSLYYSFAFVIFLTITFILFNFFYLELSYAFFLIPLLELLIADAAFIFYKREKQLKGITGEKEILKNLLAKKESELYKLQQELNIVEGNGSESLLDKIKSIKSDINKIKEKKDDETEADFNGKAESENFYGIVFRSKVMRNITELIKKIAPEDANILILGESGTGKELVARAIHQLGKRNDKNFVAVNCGALSDTLLESELFGHVKGAFTGAVSDKIGRFEAANNGTIFLDEIAETSENFQVKLLRVIQSGDFEKVGSSKTFHTNIRILAATNKNIEAAVRGKKFREDLYYRLNVIKVELPPLRERKEDIEVIAEHFLLKETDEIKFSQAAADALNNYQWKGNIRELEGVIKRAVIFARSSGRKLIQLTDLPEEIVKEVKFNFEDLVIESLKNKGFSHSSINETAKELGNVSRTLVSENFRGYVFKIYVENDFDIEKSANVIWGNNDEETLSRVKNKLKTFLNNVEKDLNGIKGEEFNEIKTKLNSKYKNLPQKFHFYLDEIIKNFIKTPNRIK
jgi:DNA-binding NtrC family response regulator/CHASE2 domain-containing sensor protein